MKIPVSLICAIFILTSCSITQDIIIKDSGQVSYAMSIDASQLMGMMPSGENKSDFPEDTVITILDIVREKKNLEKMPESERKLLYDLGNMSVHIKNDMEKKECLVSFFGDYENIEALNTALLAFAELDRREKKNESRELSEASDLLQRYNTYRWDGKIFTSTSNFDPSRKKQAEENEKEDDLGIDLFAGGKMKTKYTFPKKVLKTNNPDALFTDNGQTVIIEYSATDFIENPKITDIIIEFED